MSRPTTKDELLLEIIKEWWNCNDAEGIYVSLHDTKERVEDVKRFYPDGTDSISADIKDLFIKMRSMREQAIATAKEYLFWRTLGR